MKKQQIEHKKAEIREINTSKLKNPISTIALKQKYTEQVEPEKKESKTYTSVSSTSSTISITSFTKDKTAPSVPTTGKNCNVVTERHKTELPIVDKKTSYYRTPPSEANLLARGELAR